MKLNTGVHLRAQVAKEGQVIVMKDDAVSRQAAIDALNKEIIKRRLLDDVNDGMLDEFDTEDILRKLSPAQPEIIRCRDCKFYTPLNRETKSGICSLLIHQNFGDDWYCAGAERITDERTD